MKPIGHSAMPPAAIGAADVTPKTVADATTDAESAPIAFATAAIFQ
jgi:hypothetical protein